MSIPANIAEGRRQESERDFARFLRYAINSACELEYHLVVVQDIGALPGRECEALMAELIEVRRMLHGLLNRVMKPAPGSRGQEDARDQSPESSPV
jgi:four helix bundle protein